ncbi:MAG: hypothetical protein N2383_11145 [Caldilineales bacterium]|nr:hypothetical protein [Caldilineales bacterium]
MNEHDEADLERLAERLRGLPDTPEDPYWRLAAALVPDPEYTHEQAEAELPAYVTDELLGRPVSRLYPQLHRHLLHCAVCAELHAEMVAALSEEPPAVPTPAPNLSFLPPLDLRQEAVRVAEQVLDRVWPEVREPLARVAELFFAELDQGRDIRLSRGGVPMPAMAFGGGEAPLSLRVLVATYLAHQMLQNRYGSLDRAATATPRSEVEALVVEAAKEAGIPSRKRQAFVAAYLVALERGSW